MVNKNSVGSPKTRSITLASGVVLNVHKTPTMLIGDLTRRFPRPKPPKWFNPDTGKEEDNPDHPAYVQALSDWQMELSMSMLDNMIIQGTEIVSVPEGFSKVDDTDWSERIEAGGFVITNKAKRYLAWVKYVACGEDDDDISLLTEEIGKMSGVSEKDVDTSLDRFRDNPGR